MSMTRSTTLVLCPQAGFIPTNTWSNLNLGTGKASREGSLLPLQTDYSMILRHAHTHTHGYYMICTHTYIYIHILYIITLVHISSPTLIHFDRLLLRPSFCPSFATPKLRFPTKTDVASSRSSGVIISCGDAPVPSGSLWMPPGGPRPKQSEVWRQSLACLVRSSLASFKGTASTDFHQLPIFLVDLWWDRVVKSSPHHWHH